MRSSYLMAVAILGVWACPYLNRMAAAEGKAAALARQLLDDNVPKADREAIVKNHPELAIELEKALVADLRPGAREEYRRIPWIWQVAIAAGKRNRTEELRALLDLALPKADEPLRDWQAVVIGGGVINGISAVGIWPHARLSELLKENAALRQRWQKTLAAAAVMADNDKVRNGTRYDALRIVALDSWERSGPPLRRYLAKDSDAELQMGAISGLSDVDMPQVAPLLLEGLGAFPPSNRALALEALLRNEARTTALLNALEQGKVKPSILSKAQVNALRGHKNKTLRARAAQLFPIP